MINLDDLAVELGLMERSSSLVLSARAALAAAEAEHTRLVGVAVSRSNRPGEHDAWADVRMAGMVVHQARAALKAAEDAE